MNICGSLIFSSVSQDGSIRAKVSSQVVASVTMGAGDSVCLCVCVTLTRIFRTSGSDTLFFPNFWMLKDATFMVAAEENKKRQKGKETLLAL